MTNQVPFIDTHHHLWDLQRFPYGWLKDENPDEAAMLGDYAAIRRSYVIDDLLADFVGSHVVKSVHIQAEYSGPDPVEETEWLQGIADRFGYPHGIVAYADLTADSIRSDLERHSSYANMRGVRNFVQGDALMEPGFQRGLSALGELGLVYDLSTTWDGMAAALEAARLVPELRIVLGHAGLPLERSDEYFASWKDSMTLLAQAPNVVTKISGLGMADHDWSTESIRPWVLAAIEAFGVERCMFATNWPVDSLFSSYSRVVDAYRTIISGFSDAEQNALLWKNAERYYKI